MVKKVKTKDYFKQEKKSKTAATNQTPQTADEYLAAGVGEEEGGEKWRAGDAVKALRFFHRAIDYYTEGERRFPSSFDVVYNLARVQYTITQCPLLMKAATFPVIDYLQAASEAGKRAMKIEPENPDNLFNLGQCLTSLGEETNQLQIQSRDSNIPNDQSARLVEQAIDILQECCILQERTLKQQESIGNVSMPMDVDPNESINSQTSEWSQQMEEKWVMTQDPITPSALFDTMLAELVSLTTLCELRSTSRSRPLEWIKLQGANLAEVLSSRDSTSEEAIEAAKAMAALKLTLLDVRYKEGDDLTMDMYNDIFQSELATCNEHYERSSEGLCARADALYTHANALRTELTERSGSNKYSLLMWKQLTTAIQSWVEAAKRKDLTTFNINAAKLHLAQGDAELMRYGMGRAPILFQAAITSAAALLKNANTYYTGAERVARASRSEVDTQEAMVKQAVVDALKGEEASRLMHWFSNTRTRVVVENILREAIEDGLLDVSMEWTTLLSKIEARDDAPLDHNLVT